ncbi:MAG: hypothetical protein GX444_16675 [Myxococcales bacterium]|nr:hypothetical protein [Myxococcales bacterium]
MTRYTIALLLTTGLVCGLAAVAFAVNTSNDPWNQQDSDMSDLDLLELLRLHGVINEEQYQDLIKIYGKRTYYHLRPTGSLLVGYTPYNQMKADETIEYPGSPADDRNFRLRKLSLGMAGSAYYDWLSFKATGEVSANDEGKYTFGPEEAYVRFRYLPEQLRGSLFEPAQGMTVGAMKIPFSRQNLVSTPQLQFINRAVAIEEMPIHYDLGATVDLDYNLFFDWARLLLNAGAFNGRGDRVYAADNNDNLLYAGRLRIDLFSPLRPGEGDLRPRFYPNETVAKTPEFDRPALSLGGSLLQNNDVDKVVKAWGADAEFRWYGVSISAEAIATKYELALDDAETANQYAEDWSTFGWYVQGGAFVWPRILEVTARYDEYTLDLVDETLPERKLAATTFGLNAHLASKHALKLMANYIWRAELKGLPEMDNDTFTVQAGFAF